MKRRPGRLWLVDSFAGIPWQHRLVAYPTLLKLNDGIDCYALSHEASKCVYYHEDEDDLTLRLLYLHETHHRPAMVPGEVHALQQIYGVEEYDHREESAATYYARVFNEILGSNLKLPKPPRKR